MIADYFGPEEGAQTDIPRESEATPRSGSRLAGDQSEQIVIVQDRWNLDAAHEKSPWLGIDLIG
jgi:hypothetical protein